MCSIKTTALTVRHRAHRHLSRSVTKCDTVLHPLLSAPCAVCEGGEDTLSAIPSPSRPPWCGGGCTGQHNAYIPMPYAAHTTASPQHYTVHYTSTHPHTPSVVSPKVPLKTNLVFSLKRFIST